MIVINSHHSEVGRRLGERIGMRQKESLFRAMQQKKEFPNNKPTTNYGHQETQTRMGR